MLKENVLTDESQTVPEISPELLAKLKKEDMQQAVVERFRSKSEAPAARPPARRSSRSAYWRPADEEC
jgi:hypothetical protein